MAYKDPEQARLCNQRWYRRNAEKQKLNVKRRKQKLKKDFYEYKLKNPCRHCGESDPACIEFHHIDPQTKDIEPSNLVRVRGWAIEKVIEHLESTCIPLCSNCHKKVHRDLKILQRKLNESSTRPPARKSRR